MKKNKYINTKRVLSFLVLVFFSVVNAQKSNTDLLQLIQQKDINQIEKFDYLCELSLKLTKKDSVQAYSYANQALKIGQELDSKNKQVIALENLSKLSSSLNNLPKQIKYADQCFLLATEVNNPEAMAYANYAIALKYEIIEDNEKYISFMLKALAYFEKTKTKYDKLVNGYENLGAHFGNLNNSVVREKYVKKALDLSLESKNSINIANGLTSWALYLEDKVEKENSKDLKLLDSAANCYTKAIDLFEKNNQLTNYSYGRTCLNLSSLYMYHFYDTKADKTQEYLKKAENVCLKINSSLQLMVFYGQQAQFYTNKKDIPNIVLTLAKLEKYFDKQKKVEPRYKMLLYKNYMDLATLQNDFVGYRNYFDLYDKSNMEMIDKENRTKEFNATIKFETEEKNRKILLLSENLQAKKKISYLYGTLFVLTLISLLFMFRSYHFRQKSYVKANLLLQKANDEANLESKLKQEEALNAMLEAELSEKELQIVIQEKILTEQQKNKLQQELMTNNLQLERKNEVLKDIQEKLSFLKSEKPSEIKSISKSIDKSLETDEEFELLKTSFENTNPIFFETIQQKASGTLSKLDFKYCGYIKLGMSTKEIANQMNIEVQSMRMARYRIKQKLNLDKEEDLDSYIRNT
jgi:DNA-binding CsgD family transcriptional regulator